MSFSCVALDSTIHHGIIKSLAYAKLFMLFIIMVEIYFALFLPLHLEQRTCRFAGTVFPPFATGII